ncbi:MAG: response regulator, partial [bacterium]|nr:response regulator [bacterium]
MKNILLVDDDQDALTRLVETFEVYETDCHVFTAENGEEATAVLQTKHIDCVLTDLRMPKMDGFQLIAYMSRVCSQIPVIVMTGFGTPEIESKIRNMSKVQYMEKPVDFDLLIDLLHKVMRSESGFIKGIALPHFLQLLEMENKTCTLSISCELKQGSLYFINGKLINARYGKYEGKEAAFEIVTWEKNVEIAMSDKCHLREKQIQETLGYILLEGFHLKDANQLLSPQNVDVHEDKEPIIEPLTVSEGLHNEISRLMVILGDSLLAT